MKLLQLSDLHLPRPGEQLYGQDPHIHLREALADIAAHHADAELLVLSGDLADAGHPAAYRALRGALAGLPMPCQLMLGNHDLRDTFAAVFPEALDADGFAQAHRATPEGHLIFLDTLEHECTEGHLCPRRLAWLQSQLESARGEPVFLFAHHPPFRIGMPMLDACGLAEADALHALCQAHGNVRHLFAGHVHRPVAGSWRGIPFSAVKGTHHQAKQQFADEFVTAMEPPGYAVILIGADNVAVHFHDFPTRAQP
ncbi:MAG: phosphodiesterase [Candidatus Dactylopiibacterium carminicum]|uniref:Phosphodiesterase n=1 Tax=Candidatus Dactylopiibacterium carminicum TaxID=857335 RepID=A0A272ETH2_9RHOO|nr:metallophosphoesterase [Candidatus Dactylopiibacterium carminicum]KAF7599372.1 phosphodiesterase [Candidatus Dactylopiibacterium carminicum]PAS93382.1 MAG: phosphodiesterase [Candidatus Dactylopiibacterium carminicum]PAS99381.1 MAG: phosphodiesterase [Candidatus Dactylopiibacterium carminicum]